MYDFGDYPGVVLAPAGDAIHAELHHIDRPAILEALDAFELYRPDQPGPYDRRTGQGSLYVRRTIAVPGRPAHVYLWNGPLHRGLRIASGEWKHG